MGGAVYIGASVWVVNERPYYSRRRDDREKDETLIMIKTGNRLYNCRGAFPLSGGARTIGKYLFV